MEKMGEEEQLVFGVRMLRLLIHLVRMGMDIGYAVNDVGMSEKRYARHVACEQDKQEPFFYDMSVTLSHTGGKDTLFLFYNDRCVKYF